METEIHSTRFRPVLWSLVAYCISLALPALREPRGPQGVNNDIFGIQCLILLPWVAMYPAWYANLFYFAGLIPLAQKRGVAAFWAGLIAILLALSTFGIYWRPFMNWLTVADAKAFFPLGPGYFMWLTSMVILIVGACREMPRRSCLQPPAPPSAP